MPVTKDDSMLLGTPGSEVPVWEPLKMENMVCLDQTDSNPFEVFFEAPEDVITISHGGPVQTFVAMNSDRVVEMHGLPDAIHFHPKGSTIFCKKPQSIGRYSIFRLPAECREAIQVESGVGQQDLRVLMNIQSEVTRNIAKLAHGFIADNCAGGGVVADSIATLLLVECMKALSDSDRIALACKPDPRAQSLNRAIDFIEEHLNSDLSLKVMAGEAAMSPYHFLRSFKAYTGMPPHAFVLQRRLAEAKAMLRQTNLSIAEVAYACGFSSQSHMTSVFRRLIKATPRKYRLSVTS